MKMLKKLLAIVLTGAMALTLFTACGSNAVTEKDIVDAMNDMAKATEEGVTFTPRAKERELAKAIAALVEKESATEDNAFENEYKNILKNEKNFVWVGTVKTDELGVSGQAFNLLEQVIDANKAYNHKSESLKDKTPENTRYMGSALCKMIYNDEPITVRVIVVTAEAVDKD